MWFIALWFEYWVDLIGIDEYKVNVITKWFEVPGVTPSNATRLVRAAKVRQNNFIFFWSCFFCTVIAINWSKCYVVIHNGINLVSFIFNFAKLHYNIFSFSISRHSIIYFINTHLFSSFSAPTILQDFKFGQNDQTNIIYVPA